MSVSVGSSVSVTFAGMIAPLTVIQVSLYIAATKPAQLLIMMYLEKQN